ncbi:MAG: HdeD family acid-resistance protein [Limimaricola sp.]|uniref:HdeD family acid-resistance protein n=1 Tax=Limimaricola sp. TaxID=2211665 RepID=UPI001DEC50DD|nr:HdeD family acid-resistance protein [Limimaricola sp.]MBI1416123.1 HdeD family acid-resistance protein [Limimaricola sp.]
MSAPDPDKLEDMVLQAIRQHRRRFSWLGIVLIVLGLLALMFPFVASIATKAVIGWFFLIWGGTVLWHAFQVRDWPSALWSGAVGVLNLAIGVYLAFFPLTGLIGLTFLVGILFLFQGGFEAALAMNHRPRQGWIWLGLSALASVVLGIMLVAGLPNTALWALGMLAGINALSSGLSFLMLSRVL